MKLNLILAIDDKNGIWIGWKLPWSIKKDMKFFKDTTSNTKDLGKLNAVIMWRRTWQSIPSKNRPLEERINCILTKTIKTNDLDSKIDDFVLYFNSLEKCLKELSTKENLENVFVIWWASLYNELIKTDFVERVYLTRVKGDFKCDTFFDWIPENFSLESKTKQEKEWDYSFSFEVYEREE